MTQRAATRDRSPSLHFDSAFHNEQPLRTD